MSDRLSVAQIVVGQLAADPAALEELRALLGSAEAERMLTTHEAAAQLGVHPTTLTRWANEGRVRGAYRIGARNWRFRASELEVLPATPRDLGEAGPGQGRRPARSAAAAAIRGIGKAA